MINIPANNPAIDELARFSKWVCRNGNKIPINPNDYENASSTDPSTWSDFEKTCNAGLRPPSDKDIHGVGFVITKSDPFVGIDLDKCVDENKNINPWALKIVEQFKSYTEFSPSGSGLHIWIKGAKPGPRCRKGGLEIYDSERYLTVTGEHLEGTPEAIQERQEELEEVYHEHFGKDEEPARPVEVGEFQLNAVVPIDKINALLNNDKKFKLSWDHARSDLADSSLSSYDLSLATIAAYNGWSDQELASLIISHRVKFGDPKGKSARRDYLDRTISKARLNVRKKLTDKDAVERGSLDDAKEGTREDKLSEISGRFGVQVDGVLQRGTDPETFYLIIIGKEVLIGNIKEFLTQKNLRAKIAKATSKVLKTLKPTIFHELIELCLEVKNVEELPGGTIADQTNGWIDKYFSGWGQYVESKEDDESDESCFSHVISESKPFVKNGKLWINIESFTDWLNLSNHNVGAHTIRLRLKDIGFEHKCWSTRDNNRKVQRHYWGREFDRDEF